MNLEKSQLKYLLVLALLAITLPMAAWLASRPQLVQKRAACAVGLGFSPATATHAINSPFDVQLRIEAGTAQVAAADVSFSFDAAKLKVNSVTLGSLETQLLKDINNTNGTVRISAVKMSAGGITDGFNFATVNFEGLTVGTDPIAVTLGNINIAASGEDCSVGTKTGGSYTITGTVVPTNTPPVQPTPTGTIVPTPTGTVVPVPTATGGAARIVNFKVKLRGIITQPSVAANQTLNFKVKIVAVNDQSQVGPVYTPSGTVDADGIWTIPVTVQENLAAGAYDIYIKGPKHLQKKFPNVSFGSTWPTTADFTSLGARYYLEPGDLAISGPNHDQQDGVVNALDAGYMTDDVTGCITKPDDATCLAKADLNLDGIISIIDMELLNGTVYSKWDDEVN